MTATTRRGSSGLPLTLRGPITVRFEEHPDLDRAHRNHEERILEMQTLLTNSPPGRGAYLNRQILTDRSGTYTPTVGTTLVLVRMVAGGGGGGGSVSTTATAPAGGGNSGWYLEFRVRAAGNARILPGPFTCGAGGTAGNNAGSNGGTGGDTTIRINGRTYVAKGGTGGLGANNINQGPQPPATGSTTSGIDLACYGPGTAAIGSSATAIGYCGGGGSIPPFGSGGYQVNAGPAVGGPGLGFGAGGAGGCADFFTTAGAVGAPGAIVVDEWG